MRRFRAWRRGIAAAALLPLAATLTTTAVADQPDGPKSAQIDASHRSVPYGERVALRGVFPGAGSTPIEIRYRAKGSRSWHTDARARTGADGRYNVRVKPGRSAIWRAALATQPITRSAASGVDAGTGTELVSVRSKTRAEVRDRNALVGDKIKIKGQVTPAGAERRIVVRVDGEKVTARAGRNGHFAASWKASRTGRFDVDVTARSNRVATGSRDSAGTVTVYRPAAASWYGPGLYGNPLACGGTLSAGTLGVANKTLPCGAKVTLRYGNNTVTVPVIDRGPYAGNREYDLTAATKQRLGFPDVGTVLATR